MFSISEFVQTFVIFLVNREFILNITSNLFVIIIILFRFLEFELNPFEKVR